MKVVIILFLVLKVAYSASTQHWTRSSVHITKYPNQNDKTSTTSQNTASQTTHSQNQSSHVKKFVPEVTDVSGVYACVSNICQKVESFSVRDFKFDCHEKYLPIEFEVLDASTGSNVAKPAFLDLNGFVVEHQKRSETCFPLRRYGINNKESLVFFLDKLVFIENNYLSEFLTKEFYHRNEFLDLLLFLMGAYNVETNQIEYKKLINCIAGNFIFAWGLASITLTMISIYLQLRIFYLHINKTIQNGGSDHVSRNNAVLHDIPTQIKILRKK